jgi:gas vesicle protein
MARMSSDWPDDIALSTTYLPASGQTFAVLYGCNESQKAEIVNRITNSEDAVCHPFLIVGLFAELEKKRLSKALDRVDEDYFRRTRRISAGTNLGSDISRLQDDDISELRGMCDESESLATEMKAVKRQLEKMVNEANDFDAYISSISSDDAVTLAAKTQKHLGSVGKRIKARLREIMDEYDNKIDHCQAIMNQMTINMQTVRPELFLCHFRPGC